MSINYFRQIILLCTLAMIPLHSALADTLFDKFLRFTGISATAERVRGPKINCICKGNLWLNKIDESGVGELKKITSDGIYRSPLWVPGSNKILAVKEDKLVQLDSEEGEEKILYSLSDATILFGFDKLDTNSILILQDAEPAVLSLANGQITLIPYDKENSEDSDVLDHLKSIVNNKRDYGNTIVSIQKEDIYKIYIDDEKQRREISCPGNCTQPALSGDGRKLVFVVD